MNQTDAAEMFEIVNHLCDRCDQHSILDVRLTILALQSVSRAYLCDQARELRNRVLHGVDLDSGSAMLDALDSAWRLATSWSLGTAA